MEARSSQHEPINTLVNPGLGLHRPISQFFMKELQSIGLVRAMSLGDLGEECKASARVLFFGVCAALIGFRPCRGLFSLGKMRWSVRVMSPVICLSNCYEPSDSAMHVTLPCGQIAREQSRSAAACTFSFKINGAIDFAPRVRK